MSRKKGLLSLAIAFALLLTSFSFSFAAGNGEIVLSDSQQGKKIELTDDGLSTITVDKKDLSEMAEGGILEDDSVKTSVKQQLTQTANTSPIAGLVYLIANPETMIGGNLTTETIIYWLWNDGTNMYTYDPDGDAITDIYVDGSVSNYIIGNVTLGGNIVGFATKITEAGPHELFYQVKDSQGAMSNRIHLSFSIESADGNGRPEASITASTITPNKNEGVTFGWSNSTDPDNDPLTSVRIRVYDSKGNFEDITQDSPYFVAMDADGITLIFPSSGTYEVWFSLSDNKNAWSDWSIVQLNVTTKHDGSFKSVTLVSDDPSNHGVKFTWLDYELSVQLASQSNNFQAIYDLVTSESMPEYFRGRTILGEGGWTVEGYLQKTDGTAVANEVVTIRIPMPENREYYATAVTNSDGKFSHSCYSWYPGWGMSEGENESGIHTKWARYGNLNTTAWMYATSIIVESESASSHQVFPVVATAGGKLNRILGDRWVYIKNYGWYDVL